MADASACRIGHDSQRTGWHPASRVRFAGLRPPLTPAASSNTTESTHSKFKRGRKLNSQLHWGEGLPWWGHVLAIVAGFFIGIIHYALYKHK